MASNVSAAALPSIPTAWQGPMTIKQASELQAKSVIQDLSDPELSYGEHPRIIVGVAQHGHGDAGSAGT
jgi:hypothetical protein